MYISQSVNIRLSLGMITSSSQNELIVVGGPNGSGKTTLAKEVITDQKIIEDHE